jgi:hypothetical protein
MWGVLTHDHEASLSWKISRLFFSRNSRKVPAIAILFTLCGAFFEEDNQHLIHILLQNEIETTLERN